MPRALASQRRALGRGRKLVPDSPDCIARCCNTNCAQLYRFTPCPPEFLTSVPGPDVDDSDCSNVVKPPIHICADSFCASGGAIANSSRVLYNGFCYNRGLLIPAGDLQPTDIVVDGSAVQCLAPSIDCAHPVCLDGYGRKFIAAHACPGQSNVPELAPYFLACLVDACDVVQVPIAPYSGLCWKVDPGQGIDEADVPTGAPKLAFPVDGSNGGRCCGCVPGCVLQTSNPPQTYPHVIECCCAEARVVRLQGNSGESFNETFYANGDYEAEKIEWTTAPGTWTYDEFGVLSNQTGGMMTITRTVTVNRVGFPPNVQVTTEMVQVLDSWQCGQGGGQFVPIGYNPLPGSTCTGGEFVGIECLSSLKDQIRSCTLTNPSGDRFDQSYRALTTWTVQYLGRCAEQCGESAGTAGRSEALAARGTRERKGCSSCGDKGTGGALL